MRASVSLCLCGVLLASASLPAKFIEKPIVHYRMDVRLNAQTKTVAGKEKLTWWNHTGDTIRELQFHLYLNAFRNVQSTFMREGGEGGPGFRDQPFTGGDFKWGWTEVDRLTVNGQALSLEFIAPDDGNRNDRTVFRVVLPQPVPPQGTAEIEMDFRSKLPHVYARTGFHDNFFFVAQWFPKIGVYEAAGERHRAQGGWNCHQFHANTEFYADYGTYDVNITVPRNFVLGATGLERSRRENSDGTVTYNHYQEDVHDFAWTAQPEYLKIVREFEADKQVTPAEVERWSRVLGLPQDQVRLSNVRVTLLLQPEHRSQADHHFHAAFAALKYFGLWYGSYPYETLTVVDPPHGGSGSGGMEYPTLITAGTHWLAPGYVLSPEGVTVHEFGHQYWYGLVGNNEFEEAWLDEGFNSYSTGKVLEAVYGPNYQLERVWEVPLPAYEWLTLPVPSYPWKGVKEIPLGIFGQRVALPQAVGRRKDYLESAKSDSMSQFGYLTLDRKSYRTNAYAKPELVLRTLEGHLGAEMMARVLRTYHQRYRFRHPDARDFIATAQEVSGRDLRWYFDQVLFGSDALDYAVEATARRVPGREGVYFEDGRPVVSKPGSSGADLYLSEITVRRLGEVRFPVELQVEFTNGETVRETWDGQYRWKRFTYLRPYKARLARVDPLDKVRLDVNFANNSYLLEEDMRAGQKWYLRWVFWLQGLLMAAGFFS